jgi:hypothetical protein
LVGEIVSTGQASGNKCCCGLKKLVLNEREVSSNFPAGVRDMI